MSFKKDELSQSQWDCIYHVVFFPKRGNEDFYKEILPFLSPVLRNLAEQHRSEVVEGYLFLECVYPRMRISPRYTVSKVLGHMNGQSELAVRRYIGESHSSLPEENLWRQDYTVSTAGLNLRNYFDDQKKCTTNIEDGLQASSSHPSARPHSAKLLRL